MSLGCGIKAAPLKFYDQLLISHWEAVVVATRTRDKSTGMGLPWQSSGQDFTSSARGVGSIPDQEAKIPHASGSENQNIKQKRYCNKFNKDFKNDPHEKKS